MWGYCRSIYPSVLPFICPFQNGFYLGFGRDLHRNHDAINVLYLSPHPQNRKKEWRHTFFEICRKISIISIKGSTRNSMIYRTHVNNYAISFRLLHQWSIYEWRVDIQQVQSVSLTRAKCVFYVKKLFLPQLFCCIGIFFYFCSRLELKSKEIWRQRNYFPCLAYSWVWL